MREKCRILANMFELALEKYYETTKKLNNNKNEMILKVIQCLKAVFICHSPVSELLGIISEFI
jgi:hypothetical protein